MNCKTILVHVDQSPHAATRIALAAQLALRHDAHLLGVALTGVSRYYYREGAADLARTVLAPHMDALFARAGAALDRFARIAADAGVRSCEGRLVDDEAAAGLALSGRYADLLVLGQHEPGAPSEPPGGDLAAHVLLACPRPVLVVPYIQKETAVGKRVVVAWNGSAEAVRALDGALPLLRLAERVVVAAFAPAGQPAADPELLPWLRRHGIEAALLAESPGLAGGEPLLSLVADQAADLLVMGAYGRARLSELLLGGVTRTVLEAMTVPVLMAH
ncbi:universal stress protein [Massilia sp. Mn16-1_5]|uniref:universal stress protein n=1 Tax=Massilia sp. Mn16-1_5 TaxID=2079199 RepID=UPI00109E5683|nr:universal stress protein [Massilia sp. Mn16-1_5]THC46667.1 universal stress protein [Massilia sp. Mn16-1_5]